MMRNEEVKGGCRYFEEGEEEEQDWQDPLLVGRATMMR
jgi:hypothetical protein